LPAIRGDLYEARLVDRFRRGDAEALSGLFHLHVEGVYRYARHLLGNREDAEDVTSESFLRALRHASEYRGDSEFRGWLYAIARNLCRDRLRQPRLLPLEMEPATENGDRTDERAAIRSDLRAVVEGLPSEYQQVLLLCDVEEWDAREAAAHLGRSVAATKSLLYRARRALRDRLAERWREA
jgi:RNA polymerase sigma-70 factor (ECF subfamily)